MSVEKYIHGKVDDCNHDGLYSNTKRLQLADDALTEFVNDPTIDDTPLETNQDRHQDNLSRLHGCFYKGTYYHYGVGQTSKEE